MTAILLTPIGFVHGGRVEATDDHWGGNRSTVMLDPTQFTPDALAGLDGYSHCEVVYHFDRVAPEEVEIGARHPRGRTEWPKVGIFAQRARGRPNRIGVTTCRILGVEGLGVLVEGLDALDGTPVLDIKPYLNGFAPRGAVVEPVWAGELMAAYW